MTASELVGRLRAELSAELLEVLGSGLEMTDGPLSYLGRAFRYAADFDSDGPLAEISMRLALKQIRQFGDKALLERLAGAEEPPWSLVYEAVLAIEPDDAPHKV